MATEAGFGVVKAHRAMDFVRSPPHKCWAIIGSGSASANGSSRDVDLTGELHGPIFEPLVDPDFFAQVRVDDGLGTVVWPNGADLDPLVLHGDFEPASRFVHR